LYLVYFKKEKGKKTTKMSTGGNDLNDALSVVVLVLLIISIVGAFLTLLTFLIFKDIRTYPIKLIMYLCVTIVVANTFFILAFEPFFLDNTAACFIAGLLVHFGFLANFCWTFCIAFNFYQMIVRRNRESENLEKWYHLGCWGVPAVACLIVGANQQYGAIDGGVCYMLNPIAVFCAFFLPGLVVVSANTILFFFVAREIHETLKSAPNKDKREKRKEFRVYMSIFISIGLYWIFGFFLVLIPPPANVVFLVLFSFSAPLQGFLIFGSYCLNAKVFGKWAGLWGKCIPCCLQWEDLDTRTTTGGRSTGSGAGSSSGGRSTGASSRSADVSSSSSSSV